MNISRTHAFSRLSPLASKGPGPSAPPPQAPEPPDQNGDKASISRKVKIGAGIMLGLTVAGVAGGLVGAPQAQVQVRETPHQTGQSTSREVELGKQASQAVEKKYSLWSNPEQQARLDSIGQRLASTSIRQDIEFSFKMLDTDMVNAMALPGGHVYATRALMQKFPNDDQLAFVLGHEIAHVEQRHSMELINKNSLRQLVTLPLSFRQWNISKFFLNAGDELIGNRYTQVIETEADKIGQEHIARMGIDPDRAADAMKHLLEVTGGKHDIPVRIEQIFSDHPPSQQRIDQLHSWAAEIKARP